MNLTNKELNKLFEEILSTKQYELNDEAAFEITKKGEKYLGNSREFIPFEDVKKGMPLYYSKDGKKAGRVKRKIRDMEDLLEYAEQRDDRHQLFDTLTYKPERLKKAAEYDWVLYTDVLTYMGDGVHVAPYSKKGEITDISEGWYPLGVGCYTR